jgi:hypothetical protein
MHIYRPDITVIMPFQQIKSSKYFHFHLGAIWSNTMRARLRGWQVAYSLWPAAGAFTIGGAGSDVGGGEGTTGWRGATAAAIATLVGQAQGRVAAVAPASSPSSAWL